MPSEERVNPALLDGKRRREKGIRARDDGLQEEEGKSIDVPGTINA